MAKENAFYFSHDYNARNDDKIKKLIMKYGLLGYGVYWAIVEDLYNNANALQTDYECIAFDLRTDINIVKSIILDFDLFVFKDNIFGSLSVQRRLDERNAKSLKARESAFNRWNKYERNANALQTESESNAIKESKGNKVKEIKENNIEERKLKFADTLKPFLNVYGKELLNDFYKYWTEPNKSNTKFKMELEKTWSLERRLETWAKNDKSFNTKKTEPQNTPNFINGIDIDTIDYLNIKK